MTVSDWLRRAETQLRTAGIGTAHLDALVLLEDMTGLDRAKLLAEPGTTLPAGQAAKLAKLLKRRAAHEPLAYIRGFTEFYGRRFLITPAVLEPRPESETMIELLLQLHTDAQNGRFGPDLTAEATTAWHLADVGAGSGALGITAKLELPEVSVDLLEIDAAALRVAQTNVDLFTLHLPCLASDLLASGTPDYDVLLCNLPYVPDTYHINEAAGQEPALAIFGGSDGLAIYRKLFKQLETRQKRPLFILTESLPPQHKALQSIAEAGGYKPGCEEDFIQVFELPEANR